MNLRTTLITILALTCLAPALAQEQTRERWRGHWPKPEAESSEMAATTFRWRNTSGDRQWGTVANWDQGALPGSGGMNLDTVVFDGVSQASVIGSDRTADNRLLKIITMPAYTGDIGSDGNPLIHRTLTEATIQGRFLHRGSGRVFFEGVTANINDVVVDTPLCNMVSMTLSGTNVNVLVKSGWVSIKSTCSVTRVWAADKNAYIVIEEVDAAETRPSTIVATGGTIIDYRSTNTVGGDLIVTGSGGTIQLTGVIDSLTQFMQLGGRLIITPAAMPTEWPKILSNGHLDLADSSYSLAFGDLVLGPLCNVTGQYLPVPDTIKGMYIDLRDEYP